MSDVDVVNDALSYIGKASINDLSDPEPTARYSKDFLPLVLREMQAVYGWQFNRAVVVISKQAADSPYHDYKYAHQLPADYLRFVGARPFDKNDADLIIDSRGIRPWDADADVEIPLHPSLVAGGMLHTNFTPVRLAYHQFARDTSKLPALFRAAVVAELAARLVFPLTRDTRLFQTLTAMALQKLTLAKDVEDQDSLVFTPNVSSILDARK